MAATFRRRHELAGDQDAARAGHLRGHDQPFPDRGDLRRVRQPARQREQAACQALSDASAAVAAERN
jgi:hypothetical protein